MTLARWALCLPIGWVAYMLSGVLVRGLVWFVVGAAWASSPLIVAEDIVPPAIFVLTTSEVAPRRTTGAILAWCAVVALSALAAYGAMHAHDYLLLARLGIAPVVATGLAWGLRSSPS